MEEIWKDIPGYEGRYQASNLGRIRSLDRVTVDKNGIRKRYRGRVLHSYKKDSSGHLALAIGHNRNIISVHQMVAAAFLGPCPEGYEILHGSGGVLDNRPENLRYDTHAENCHDVYRHGSHLRTLRLCDVHEIRFGLASGMTTAELARMYGVGDRMIQKIRRRERYGWLE